MENLSKVHIIINRLDNSHSGFCFSSLPRVYQCEMKKTETPKANDCECAENYVSNVNGSA